MTQYKHTQVGYLIICISLLLALFFSWLYRFVAFQQAVPFPAVVVMCTTLLLLALFSTLTVSVDDRYVRIVFGYFAFRKKILLSDILMVRAVKNPWYYGWGIRVWFWPYTWIYNVSGFDAVEVVLKNGKMYRIGTDEPHALEAALKAALSSEQTGASDAYVSA